MSSSPLPAATSPPVPTTNFSTYTPTVIATGDFLCFHCRVARTPRTYRCIGATCDACLDHACGAYTGTPWSGTYIAKHYRPTPIPVDDTALGW